MTEVELYMTKKILSFFESMSEDMVRDLQEIISGDFGLYDDNSREKIAFLDFEISTEGFSTYLYSWDKDYTQLGFKETLKEYPDGSLSEDSIWEIEGEFEEEELFGERSLEYYENLEKEYIIWFSKCWDAAGGKNAEYDFHIAFHDTNESFDLRRKIWVDDRER